MVIKKQYVIEITALEKVYEALIAGRPARSVGLTVEQLESIKSMMLLTLKPVIYAANVADSDLSSGNEMSKKVFDYAVAEGNKAVLVSAQVESELTGLGVEDRREFLDALGVTEEECGLKVCHT